MKLKVYQQGGGLIYTPFIPEQQVNNKTERSSSDIESKLDPLDKELISLMKDQDLLPSDINQIFNQIVAFQKRTQGLSSEGYRSAMPGMLQILNLASRAKYEKSKAADVENKLRSENAWADPALDQNGRMYVTNLETGELELINPSQYNSDLYRPISNSQLLNYREQKDSFNNNILTDLQQAVGMTSISKELDRIIKAFGSAEKEGYIDKRTAEALHLLDGSSPEGIYKLTQRGSSPDIDSAVTLVFRQLPANMQQALHARASISDMNTQDLVKAIVISNLSSKTGINFDSTTTKSSGIASTNGAGGDEKNLTEYGYIENLATGRNFELPKYTAFNTGSNITLHTMIQNTGILMKDDGTTPVGAGMVDAIFETVGGIKQISPQYTVTFGDQILDETALGQLMYDGSPLQRIKLPYTEVNGEFTVDWGLMDVIEDANKQIKEKGASPAMIKDIIQNNPKLTYNEDSGLIEATNSMWFLTFGAMMGNDFVEGLNTDSKYLERMSKEKSDFWHQKYEEAAEYGFVQHDKNAPKRTNAPTDKGFLGIDWHTTRYYHGNVFIPILNDLAGAKQYYSKGTHMNNAQTKAMNDRDAQIQQEMESGVRKFNW